MKYKNLLIKATGISGMILFVFLVLSFLLISAFSKIYGYGGYCTYIELPYEKYIYYLESIWFLLFWIPVCLKFAFKPEHRAFTFKPIVWGVLLFNLTFLAGKIIQYPRIQLPHIFDAPCDDQHCGLDYNPLILMFLGFFITSVIYSWCLKKSINHRLFLFINILFVVLLFFTSLVVIINIEYEMCAG